MGEQQDHVSPRSVSIVIPAYNEESGIETIIRSVREVMAATDLESVAIGLEVSTSAWLLAWPLAKIVALVPASLGGIGVREVALAVFGGRIPPRKEALP